MNTRSMFLSAALSIVVMGSAQAKVRNDAGALAAAGVLGGALGFCQPPGYVLVQPPIYYDPKY